MQPLPLHGRPLRLFRRVRIRIRVRRGGVGVGVGVILERPRQRNQVLRQQTDPIRRGDKISEKPFFAGLSERQKADLVFRDYRRARHADQTWMFAREQWASALSREVCRAVMSSRATEVGSGRRSPAASEAFAMATWWEAMLLGWMVVGEVEVETRIVTSSRRHVNAGSMKQ